MSLQEFFLYFSEPTQVHGHPLTTQQVKKSG